MHAGVRAHRRAAVWLEAGTALCVGLLVLSLTRHGGQVQSWLLD